MKKGIILSGLAITLILGACNSPSNKSGPANDKTEQIFNLDTTKLKSGETYYQCQMNHEVISDKPGNCPVCGMELSEMEKK